MYGHSSRITNDCVRVSVSCVSNAGNQRATCWQKGCTTRVLDANTPRECTLVSETSKRCSIQRGLCLVLCAHLLALLLHCQPRLWWHPTPPCRAIWHHWPHCAWHWFGETKLTHPSFAAAFHLRFFAVIGFLGHQRREVAFAGFVLSAVASTPRWAICWLVWHVLCLLRRLLRLLCVGRFADVITMLLSHIMVFVLNANHNIPYSTCSETLCCIRVSECASFEVV